MSEKRRSHKVLIVTLVTFAVVLGVAYGVLHLPIPPEKLRIGPDTTFIDGPLKADGTPDYIAAMNAKLSEGVTPDNNAGLILIKILGLERTPEQSRQIWRQAGGADADFPTKPLYIPWSERAFVATTSQPTKGTGKKQAKDIGDVLELARRGEFTLELVAWLAQNEPAFSELHAASSKSKLYIPMAPDDSKTPLFGSANATPIRVLLEACQCLSARSVMRMKQNDANGAWNDVLALHRLARLIDTPANLLQPLIASAIEREAADSGISLTTRDLLGDNPEAILHELTAMRPLPSIAEACEGERLVVLDAAITLAKSISTGQNIDKCNYIDINELLIILNAWHERGMVPTRLPPSPQRLAAKKAYQQQVDEYYRSRPDPRLRAVLAAAGGWATRKMATHLFADTLLFTGYARIGGNEDKANTAHNIEVLAVALAIFHKDTGRWPAALEELSPRYVKEIPMDPFSFKPLIYRTTEDGYVLYSVGADATDNGGDPSNDIVARVGAK